MTETCFNFLNGKDGKDSCDSVCGRAIQKRKFRICGRSRCLREQSLRYIRRSRGLPEIRTTLNCANCGREFFKRNRYGFCCSSQKCQREWDCLWKQLKTLSRAKTKSCPLCSRVFLSTTSGATCGRHDCRRLFKNLRRRRWAEENPQRYAEGQRAKQARRRARLTDGYILNKLGFRHSDNIPKDFLNLARAKIVLLRRIQDYTKNNT